MSADGRTLLFTSSASYLTPGDGNGVPDECDIQSGAEYRIALTLYSAALRPFDKLKRGSLPI